MSRVFCALSLTYAFAIRGIFCDAVTLPDALTMSFSEKSFFARAMVNKDQNVREKRYEEEGWIKQQDDSSKVS